MPRDEAVCSVCLEVLSTPLPDDEDGDHTVRITHSANDKSSDLVPQSESSALPMDIDSDNSAKSVPELSCAPTRVSLLQHTLEEEYIARLDSCTHEFHYICVRPWLLQANSCPTCRTPTSAIIVSTPAPNECHIRTEEVKKSNLASNVAVTEPDDIELLEVHMEVWDEDNRAIVGPCNFCDDVGEEAELMICDGCDAPVHMRCAGLGQMPDTQYFCHLCQDRSGRQNPLSISRLPWRPTRFQIANYIYLSNPDNSESTPLTIFDNLPEHPLRYRSLLLGIFGRSRNPYKVRLNILRGHHNTSTEVWAPPLFPNIPDRRLLDDDDARMRISAASRPRAGLRRHNNIGHVPYIIGGPMPGPETNTVTPDPVAEEAWSVLDEVLDVNAPANGRLLGPSDDSSSSSSGATFAMAPIRTAPGRPRPGRETAGRSSSPPHHQAPAAEVTSADLRRPMRRKRPAETEASVSNTDQEAGLSNEETTARQRKKPCQRRASPAEPCLLPELSRPSSISSRPSLIRSLLEEVQSVNVTGRPIETGKNTPTAYAGASCRSSSPSPAISPSTSRGSSPDRSVSPTGHRARSPGLSTAIGPEPGYSGTLKGKEQERGRTMKRSRIPAWLKDAPPEAQVVAIPSYMQDNGSSSSFSRAADQTSPRQYSYNRAPDDVARAVQASVRKHMTHDSGLTNGQFGSINAKVDRLVRQKLQAVDASAPEYASLLLETAEEEVKKEVDAIKIATAVVA